LPLRQRTGSGFITLPLRRCLYGDPSILPARFGFDIGGLQDSRRLTMVWRGEVMESFTI
jgi:hypothetical protein